MLIMELLILFIGPRIRIQSACYDILSYAGVLFLPVIIALCREIIIIIQKGVGIRTAFGSYPTVYLSWYL